MAARKTAAKKDEPEDVEVEAQAEEAQDADEADEAPLDPIIQSAIAESELRAEGPPDPVHTPDGTNRRHGDDALEGHFVKVLAGDEEGRTAAYLQTLTRDDDGWPETILVQSRDADSVLFSVPYEDVEHAGDYRGGR